jgi:hypothetical protein
VGLWRYYWSLELVSLEAFLSFGSMTADVALALMFILNMQKLARHWNGTIRWIHWNWPEVEAILGKPGSLVYRC